MRDLSVRQANKPICKYNSYKLYMRALVHTGWSLPGVSKWEIWWDTTLFVVKGSHYYLWDLYQERCSKWKLGNGSREGDESAEQGRDGSGLSMRSWLWNNGHQNCYFHKASNRTRKKGPRVGSENERNNRNIGGTFWNNFLSIFWNLGTHESFLFFTHRIVRTKPSASQGPWVPVSIANEQNSRNSWVFDKKTPAQHV